VQASELRDCRAPTLSTGDEIVQRFCLLLQIYCK
jgi:hypothetical protein